ncbi:STAS domain-containing protein [Streptomyces sp. NPDC001480]|uniref:STAS domain-containing protein n=1 Tax=Streptomyces sp. NPDC001480 TaxID=3364577 RepID=UPI0036A297C8
MTGGVERRREPLDSSPGMGGDAVVAEFAQGEAWVVVVRGEFDLNTSGALAEALGAAARARPRVVVDAAGVSFADSVFLTLLLRVHGQTDLRVAAPSPQLVRVLELTGADRVLDVRVTVEDAVVE